MISFLAFSDKKEELKNITDSTFEISANLSEDDWKIQGFFDIEKLKMFLSDNPIIDISCLDITVDGGIELAENVRKNNCNMYIVVVADTSISPTLYIKPSIMASSLLLKPITSETIKNVFLDCFKNYLKKFKQESSDTSFIIDNREGRQLIPFGMIIFFEARSKKIFLNAEGTEYSFYDTLDNLEKRLDNSFIRCHRSFIIAKSRIKKVMLSKSLILLDNGYEIPLSRTYKGVIKELTI